MMRAFAKYVGIDYSGAETPTASLKGLCVYLRGRRSRCRRHHRPGNTGAPKGIAEWLVERLVEDVPLLVGIDHGFSFPLRYSRAEWDGSLAAFLKPELRPGRTRRGAGGGVDIGRPGLNPRGQGVRWS